MYPLHDRVSLLVGDGIVAKRFLDQRRSKRNVKNRPPHLVLHVVVDQILQHSSLHYVVFVFEKELESKERERSTV